MNNRKYVYTYTIVRIIFEQREEKENPLMISWCQRLITVKCKLVLILYKIILQRCSSYHENIIKELSIT